jgi:hypothetical protein
MFTYSNCQVYIFLFHGHASRGKKKDGFRGGGMEEEKEEAKRRRKWRLLRPTNLNTNYKFKPNISVYGGKGLFPHAAFGWRIHCGVEVTELSTNKQHTLSLESHAYTEILGLNKSNL